MTEYNGESRLDRIREALADAQMCLEQSQRVLLRSLKHEPGQPGKEINRLAESKRSNYEAAKALAASQQCMEDILRSRKQ